MTGGWVASVPRGVAASCGKLRRIQGIEFLEEQGLVWLRGAELPRDLELRLRTIPDLKRFRVLDDGRLVRDGARVPSGHLPGGEWRPISQAFPVATPVAALGAEQPERVPLDLVRGGQVRAVNVLLTDLTGFRRYVETAAEFRFRELQFAVRMDGATLVWGGPSPPLPGRRYLESRGIAIPAGCTWSPPVDDAVLSELLRVREGELVLFDEARRYERIESTDFVPASRSAVRITAREFDGL